MRAHPSFAVALVGVACTRQPAAPWTQLPLRACSAADARPFPAAAAEPAPAAPPPDLRVGTTHPAVLVASALDGRWTAFCQARRDTDGDGRIAVSVGPHGSLHGDAMQLYLVEGEGEGEAIDALVDATPDGRHLAFVRGGRLLLRDTDAATTVDLTALGADADADGDAAAYERHRAGSFDASGRRFVWIRGRGAAARVMVRTLADGRDRAIEPPPGLLDRAWVDPAGAWLVVRSVARDTDGDGRITPPRVDTTYPGFACRGGIGSYSNRGPRGDAGETWVAPAAGGALRPVHELAEVVGEAAVLRRADGALDALTPDGRAQAWTPAGCAGRVVAYSRPLGRALVVCGGRWRGALSVHGDGVHCALPARGEPSDEREGRLRFASVRRSGGASLTVDLARAAVLPTEGSHELCVPSVWGGRSCDGLHTAFVRPNWLASQGLLFALRARPLAVDRRGRALLPASAPTDPHRDVPLGPLVWSRPPAHTAVGPVVVPLP